MVSLRYPSGDESVTVSPFGFKLVYFPELPFASEEPLEGTASVKGNNQRSRNSQKKDVLDDGLSSL